MQYITGYPDKPAERETGTQQSHELAYKTNGEISRPMGDDIIHRASLCPKREDAQHAQNEHEQDDSRAR